MIEIYKEQLTNQTRELELMTTGAIAHAGMLITRHMEPVADDKLTLQDVCYIADSLNSMLAAIHRKQEDIEISEKLIEKEEAKAKEQGDDNHQ